METLGKLFGGDAKVKIMRLFLFNPDSPYAIPDISLRSKVSSKQVKKELIDLSKAGLIKRQKFTKQESFALTGNKINKIIRKKKRIQGWILNEKFVYLNQIRNLLISTILLKDEEIVRRVSKSGKIKIVIVSGVFLQNWDTRADILVVGDNVKDSTLQKVIRGMEAEIGKELRYASLGTQDFQYRMSICDKLVRDIFDYPHKVILDKMGIKLSF